jgi:hypothetical protein
MAYVEGYQGNFNPNLAAVISASTTTSAVINLGGFTLCGIQIPAAFTGTALTFLVCSTATGTFVPLKTSTSGTSLSYTVAQGTYAAINPQDFYGVNYLQIVSGSTEGSARTLICSVKGF